MASKRRRHNMLEGKGGFAFSRKSLNLAGRKRSRRAASLEARVIRRKGDEEEQLFEVYCDKKSDTISGDYFQKFWKDLEILPGDLLELALFWKWGCNDENEITRREFIMGMQALGCKTMNELKIHLRELRKQLDLQWDLFRELYLFSFQLKRKNQTTNKKTIAVSVARQLLDTLLRQRFPNHIEPFNLYLATVEKETPMFRITNDQWTSYLAFVNTVDAQTLAGYDADGAWPVLMDTYAEWYRDTHLQKLSLHKLTLTTDEDQTPSSSLVTSPTSPSFPTSSSLESEGIAAMTSSSAKEILGPMVPIIKPSSFFGCSEAKAQIQCPISQAPEIPGLLGREVLALPPIPTLPFHYPACFNFEIGKTNKSIESPTILPKNSSFSYSSCGVQFLPNYQHSQDVEQMTD